MTYLKPKLISLTLLSCLLHTSIYSADYFWVGGSGDWSDISHWAVASGGSQTHPQTPTANDDVHFNENSFTAAGQVVTINGTIATCKNMNWNAARFNPTFRSTVTNANFQIYGSVNMIQQMTFQYVGIIQFLGVTAEARLINFENFDQGSEIVFSGTTGSWHLANNIKVSDKITFLSGTLNLGDATITARYFLSKTSDSRTLNFQNATLNLTGNANDINFYGYDLNQYTLDIFGVNFNSTGGTSTTNITDPNGKIFINYGGKLEMGNLNFTNTGGLSEILNFNYMANFSLTGNLNCAHNMNFRSTMSMMQMKLAPGYTYQFDPKVTSNFKTLSLIGSCTGATFLNSLTSGEHTTFNAAEAFTIDYVSLRDVHMMGPGSAKNTIDLGNNTGWNLLAKTSQPFYWVNGTGNWSDANHWSFTSGGGPSGCIPSALDDVFFDNNSFTANNQKVSLDLKTALVKSMIWDNVRTGSSFEGTEEKILYLNGSLEFDQNTVNNFGGFIHFIAGDVDNTIRSNSVHINNNIVFNNPTGRWSVVDSLYVHLDIIHTAGEVVFQNIFATTAAYRSDVVNFRKLTLGSSTFEISNRPTLNLQPAFQLRLPNYVLDAGTSKIVFKNGYSGRLSCYSNTNTPTIVTFYDLEYHTVEGEIAFGLNTNLEYRAHKVTFHREGIIGGKGRITNLKLEPGYTYTFGANSLSTIDTITGGDICKGLISLKPYLFFRDTPLIIFTTNQTLHGYAIRSIDASSPLGSIVCTSSLDQGNNTGFTFVNGGGRNLYWVHHNVYWDDPMNWSLTSGGTTGECIPTLLDNVIFDGNSFEFGFENVRYLNNVNSYCKDLDFNVPGFAGRISLAYLYIGGDLTVVQDVNFEVTSFYMVGNNGSQHIQNIGTGIESIYIQNQDTVILESDLKIKYSTYVLTGTFDTNDKTLTSSIIYAFKTIGNPVINAGKSEIILTGESYYPSAVISINEGAKLFGADAKFTIKGALALAYFVSKETTEIGEILYDNINGKGGIILTDNAQVRKLTFYGNGEFLQNYIGSSQIATVDSLIFSAGHSYSIDQGTSLRVDSFLLARGNNCNPISLFSSSSSAKANLLMNTGGRINMDFVEMRDIVGIGGADFNAGPYSTNISNSNVNWTFPELTVDNNIGVLGPDKFLCTGEAVALDAFSFTPMETYLWENGSTSSLRDINAAGKYAVRIEFQNNCVIRDTIEIFSAQSLENFLPNDTAICDQGAFVAEIKIANPDITYLWSDQSTASSLAITKGGSYAVAITLDGCTFSDTLIVDYIDFESIDLGRDTSACEGASFVLAPNIQNALLEWSTGSMEDSITITQSGTYTVKVSKDVCIISDTIVIAINPIPIFSLGQDTSICEGESLVLAPGLAYAVTWQDGSNALNFTASVSKLYTATASLNNCVFSDSIQIQVNPAPVFSLGPDTLFCNVVDLELIISIPDADIIWSDNSTDSTFRINIAGDYNALVTKDGCTFQDEIIVRSVTLDKPELRPDTTICERQNIVLTVQNLDNREILWSTGSTLNTISVTDEGSYTVTVIFASCRLSDTFNLRVSPLPTVILDANYFICEGANIEIKAKGQYDDFSWRGQPGSEKLTVSSPGTYTYDAQTGNCFLASFITVQGVSLPQLDLGIDFSKCADEIVLIGIESVNDVDALWQDGVNDFTREVQKSGKYVLTLSKEGCERKDSVLVENMVCSNTVLYFPNILNANSFEDNAFKPTANPDFVILSYTLSIFDRWGNKVFESVNLDDSWNGTINGAELNPGVFSYVAAVEYTGRKDGKEVIPGNITLVR